MRVGTSLILAIAVVIGPTFRPGRRARALAGGRTQTLPVMSPPWGRN
jgi:hypothetical protein